MKKYKILRNIFIVLTLVLSHLTFAVVAFNYAGMLCGIEHRGFSAPANTVFYLAIPYYIGIVVCAALALVFSKRSKEEKG